MKTLILSDIHIGDPRVKRGKGIIELLESPLYDRIILNGDIIDLWSCKVKDIKDHPVIKKIDEVSEIKSVIWLSGNHDWDTKNIKNIWPKVHRLDSFRAIENEHRILVMHGNQVYCSENKSWYNKLLYKINIWLWKIFGCDLQKKLQEIYCYEHRVKSVRRKILKKYGKDVDYILIGHTHLVGWEELNGTYLVDAGSTIFTRTYATIENGHVHLKKL
jgi:predicted phosphodiesterase